MNEMDLTVVLQQVCLLQPDQPLLVGVSGGADSLCLLGVLCDSGYPVVAAHFNHHLRPEAAADAEIAAREAARRGVPFVYGEADVAALARAEGRLI